MNRALPHRRPDAAEVLSIVASLGDDGFVPYRDVAVRLRDYGERQIRRGVTGAVRQGLLIERRDPQGRRLLALSSEGWRVQRIAG
jgi:hypothetical protein